MIVIIDTNERATNPKIVASLEKYYKTVITTTLPSGDVNVPLDDGSILSIERKSPNDFLASIADRRIFEQLENMANNAKYCAVIITGSFTYSSKTDMVKVDNEETNWHGNSVRAVLRLIQLSGCILEYCPPAFYPFCIEEIYKTVNKPDRRQGLKQNRIVTFPAVDERVQIIAQFPGVGLQRAEALLKFAHVMGNGEDTEYGTLAEAIEWATIMVQVDKESRPAGWGPKTILNFRKMLGLKSTQYMKIAEESNQEESEEQNA